MTNDSSKKKIKTKRYPFVVKGVKHDEVVVLLRDKDDKRREATFNRFIFKGVGADVVDVRGKITLEEAATGFGKPVKVKVETGGRKKKSPLREAVKELKECGFWDETPTAAQIIAEKIKRAAVAAKDPYVMSETERMEHEASVAGLVPGKRYKFSTPIEAGAISDDGRVLGSMKFTSGHYLGQHPGDDACFFEGLPIGGKCFYIFKIIFTGGALCLPAH